MKSFGKIKNIFLLAIFMVMGFCFFANSNANAQSITRYGVSGSSCVEDGCTIDFSWKSDANANTGIAYGLTEVLNINTWISPYKSDHNISVGKWVGESRLYIGDNLYANLKITNSEGDPFDVTGPFAVVAGAPFLKSLNSTTIDCTGNSNCLCGNGVCIYGPGSEINITAIFNEDLDSDSAMTVVFNNGESVPLSYANSTTLTGIYTVGNSGEDEDDLDVSSITGQNVYDLDETPNTTTNGILPTPEGVDGGGVDGNLGENNNIVIDTTAPIYGFKDLSSDTKIKSLADWNYTLIDNGANIASGAVVFTRVGGAADGNSPHTCTLVGSGLNTTDSGGISFNSATMCDADDWTNLENGTIYDITFTGTDNYGNSQNSQGIASNITYDSSSPELDSFSATPISSPNGEGIYEDGDQITITANFDEDLRSGSTMTVTLNNEGSVVLSTISGTALSGTYTVGNSASCQNTDHLRVDSIDSSSINDLAGNDDGVYSISIPDDNAININTPVISIDTTQYTIQYYSDGSFENSLGYNPRLKAGTYYLRMDATCAISGFPSVDFTAEGSGNTRTLVSQSGGGEGKIFYVTRVIIYDALAVGEALEEISITGTSTTGVEKTVVPTNAQAKSAYTDTIKPVVESSAVSFTQTGADAGTANVSLTFSEAMDSDVDVTAALTINGTAYSVSGKSFSDNNTVWTGTISITSNFNYGSGNLKISLGQDLAGNVMDADAEDNNISLSYPVVASVANGVSADWTNNDVINITINGSSQRYYGFSADATCNSSDTYGTSFTSGSDFSINNTDHTNYLCIKAQDATGNNVIYYDFINQGGNQLHVDVTVPEISNIYATPFDDNVSTSYAETDTINIQIDFSEGITINDLEIEFETGDANATCTVETLDSDSGICNFEVIEGFQTNRLQAISPIATTPLNVIDRASNALNTTIDGDNNFNGQIISINTTAPALDSVTSTTANGTYGPGQPNPPGYIDLKATYDKPLAEGATVTLLLSSGASVILNTLSGDTLSLSGTYTICGMDGTPGCSGGDGDNEKNITDLEVADISSQSVCDLANHCLTTTGYSPPTNISDGSTINIDTTAPNFSNVAPTDGSNVNSLTTASGISYQLSETATSATITITLDEVDSLVGDENSPHTCTLTGTYLNTEAHNNFDTTNCQEGEITLEATGTYTYLFSATDAYGNIENEPVENVTYGMDVDDPIISSCSVTDISSSSAVVSWTTNEPTDAYVEYEEVDVTPEYGKNVGNNDASLTSHTITLLGLTGATPYKFRVLSTDLNNNTTTAFLCGGEDTFQTANPLDVTPPVISSVSSSDITGSNAKINWTTDEISDSYVEYGLTTEYGKIFGSKADVQTHAITLPSDLESTTLYHFKVHSTDGNGNEAESGDYSFTTTTNGTDPPDGEDGPTISSIKVSVGDDPNSMVVTWNTDENANGLVRFGLDDTYGQTVAEDLTADNTANFITSHSVTLNGLLSNASYSYKVVSYDVDGNIAVSSNGNFSTSALQILSEPKVSNASTDSVVIVWDTLDPSFSGIEYGTTTSYGKTFQDAILANTHRVELTDLQAGQVYHFKIKGGKSSDTVYSKDYLFGTFAKPVVSGIGVDEVKDSSALVKWVVNVPSESYVEYQNVNDPEDQGTKGLAGLQTDNQVLVEGLTQGSQYKIKIKGTDVNKNDFESTEINFETLIDITPPEISQVSTDSALVTGKEDKVQTIISWKTDELATSQVAFDVGGQTGSELAQKSKEDANLTTNHLVVLTNLRSGTVYHFKVISKDKNANLSESQDFTLLTPQKKQSVIQMIIANFEQSFGFLKKLRN